MFLEILPLVEFYLEEGIPTEEALQLIKTEPPKVNSSQPNNGNQDYQVYENNSQQANDPFAAYFQSSQQVKSFVFRRLQINFKFLSTRYSSETKRPRSC